MGHLCPECDAAVESVGSIGVTSMVRAVVTCLRGRGQDDLARRIEQADSERTATGIVAWSVTGLTPNEAPWAHLDLSEA